MKIYRIVAAAALALISYCPANAATYLFNFAIGELPSLTDGVSTAILVVDTAGNGFTGINTATSDIANFSQSLGNTVGDDLVIATLTANSNTFDLGGPISFDTANPLWGGLLTGVHAFGVYWFDSGSNSIGQNFGFYRTDTLEDGSQAYFTSNASGTYETISATLSAGGSGFAGTPTFGTIGAIPEPSRALLLGLAGMLTLFRRRRA